jgi:hypothetical protein
MTKRKATKTPTPTPTPTLVLRPVKSLTETRAVLEDYRAVLEQLLFIDREHNWGYAAQFEERIERVDALLGPARRVGDHPAPAQGKFGYDE